MHTQVVLVLRWLRHRLDLRLLAQDAAVSIATAYRYLHEALDVIAAHLPELGDVLARARAEAGHDLWYSGKHHASGGNVPVLCDPTGFPLWISDVRPGGTHDLTAAREKVLPALYPHATRGLPVFAGRATSAPAPASTPRASAKLRGRCTPTTAATTS